MLLLLGLTAHPGRGYIQILYKQLKSSPGTYESPCTSLNVFANKAKPTEYIKTPVLLESLDSMIKMLITASLLALLH